LCSFTQTPMVLSLKVTVLNFTGKYCVEGTLVGGHFSESQATVICNWQIKNWRIKAQPLWLLQMLWTIGRVKILDISVKESSNSYWHGLLFCFLCTLLKYVTEFAKRGLPLTFTFITLKDDNLAIMQDINLKLSPCIALC